MKSACAKPSAPFRCYAELCLFLPLASLALALSIYFRSEWATDIVSKGSRSKRDLDEGGCAHSQPPLDKNVLLESERKQINDINLSRQQQPRRLAIQDRRAEERQRGPEVHGRARDIEGKTRNRRIHQDAKIVSQVRPREAQSPHGAKNQRVAEE